MGRLILVFILILNHCAKDDLSNPNDVGTESFWQKQELLCLVGQLSLCATSVAAPGTPTVTAGNTQNTITWSSVSGATSYNLIYATSSGVTKSNGTIIANATSPYVHSGLTNGRTIYYVIVAVNGGKESVVSQEASGTPLCSLCRIYNTATTYDGNLGGISGADAKCMADSNKPTSGTFKAMIVDTNTRIACTSNSCVTSGLSEHKDWVFQPNKVYVRAADSVTILTTNSLGLWTTQPGDALTSNSLAGFRNGFNMSNVFTTNANNCANWTDNTTGQGSAANSSASISNSTNGFGCTTAYSFFCVEQ